MFSTYRDNINTTINTAVNSSTYSLVLGTLSSSIIGLSRAYIGNTLK